jgi:hypothetical protein
MWSNWEIQLNLLSIDQHHFFLDLDHYFFFSSDWDQLARVLLFLLSSQVLDRDQLAWVRSLLMRVVCTWMPLNWFESKNGIALATESIQGYVIGLFLSNVAIGVYIDSIGWVLAGLCFFQHNLCFFSPTDWWCGAISASPSIIQRPGLTWVVFIEGSAWGLDCQLGNWQFSVFCQFHLPLAYLRLVFWFPS